MGSSRPRNLLRRPSLSAAIALGLIFILVFAPEATSVEATSAFTALRAPGQTGFVAGHRGDSVAAPENTLPAFQLAIDSDAAFVETDVQLTADGVPVLMHDWTLDRTTTGTGPIWEHTAEQLAALDAGSWYAPRFAGTKIPTLNDLLSILRPSGKGAILELKGSWNATQVAIVADQLYAHHIADRVIFASFDLMTLKALADVSPDIPRMMICRVVVGDPAILAGATGASAIVTSQDFVESDPDAVSRIHDAGLGVLLYTLNDEAQWMHAVNLGVDGIITDMPGELNGWLATSSEIAVAAGPD